MQARREAPLSQGHLRSPVTGEIVTSSTGAHPTERYLEDSSRSGQAIRGEEAPMTITHKAKGHMLKGSVDSAKGKVLGLTA